MKIGSMVLVYKNKTRVRLAMSSYSRRKGLEEAVNEVLKTMRNTL